MSYSVRKAILSDLPVVESIYAGARHFMAEHGNPHQWRNTEPPTATLHEDIDRGTLFVVTRDGRIHGVFAFFLDPDPTYAEIFDGTWRSDRPYGTIHRIASDGSGGILKTAVAFGKGQISHLRIDTHHDNYVMQNAVAKEGFQRRGIIYIEDGTPRIAYDML